MALTEKSNLVSAPNGTAVSKYELRVNSKVDTDNIIIDAKASDMYNKITSCYTKLNKYFKELGSEYRKCANQSVKGDKIVSSLKKVATNCENQGQYCLNRKKQLEQLFKYDLTKVDVTQLELAAGEVVRAGSGTVTTSDGQEVTYTFATDTYYGSEQNKLN